MHDVRRINVMENIHDENDHIAAHTNEALSRRGILAVNEMGAPGVGKTTCLKKIIERLKSAVCVIEGDIESDLDTADLRKMGIPAAQINTFGACHLDAPLVHNAVQNMDLPEDGILFIENIGNLVCPAEFSIGEHVKMLISTVTEGSDKPYKYPLAFEKADLILVNKSDLLPYVDFDRDFFEKGIRALNKDVKVIYVSGKTGEGFDQAAEWLEERRSRVRKEAASGGHHHHGHHHGQGSGSHSHEHGDRGGSGHHSHEHGNHDGSGHRHE